MVRTFSSKVPQPKRCAAPRCQPNRPGYSHLFLICKERVAIPFSLRSWPPLLPRSVQGLRTSSLMSILFRTRPRRAPGLSLMGFRLVLPVCLAPLLGPVAVRRTSRSLLSPRSVRFLGTPTGRRVEATPCPGTSAASIRLLAPHARKRFGLSCDCVRASFTARDARTDKQLLALACRFVHFVHRPAGTASGEVANSS